jgi:hypothetical protein
VQNCAFRWRFIQREKFDIYDYQEQLKTYKEIQDRQYRHEQMQDVLSTVGNLVFNDVHHLRRNPSKILKIVS